MEHPNFNTGRYADVTRGRIADKLSRIGDHDPTDLLDELQIQRALIGEFVDNLQPDQPIAPDAINSLMIWTENIGRMVERIVRMKNQTALTGAEVAFLVSRVVDTVTKYISDESIQRAFIEDLFGALPGSDPAEAQGQLVIER